MAESISEGTLKTWLKQVGDTVAADEEVATIETDKVCVLTLLPRNWSCTCVTACALARSMVWCSAQTAITNVRDALNYR